jgi:hypothetical protein
VTHVQRFDALRCSSCGAPLPPDATLQIITCQYCGVSQQRIDAEKYIEQLRTDVYRWVQSLVPTASVQSAAQIDPVARAQIFEHTIRQDIEQKRDSWSMQLLTACSNHLLVPPFLSAPSHFSIASSIDPKNMLNESARLQGLVPFAQSDDQTSLLNATAASSETLGYVSNVMRIATSSATPSYTTMARNFRGASESLAKDKSKLAGATRMEGLALANEGLAFFIDGKFYDAQKKFMDADNRLQEAQKAIITQTSIISWFAGIKSEANIVGSLKIAVDGAQAGCSTGLSANDMLKRLETYSRAFESARKSIGSLLHTGDRIDPDTYRELCRSFAEINMAKSGQRPVTVLFGGGQIWIACWLVDLNYTFATGVLFMKKGLMMTERLLLPGLFSLNPARLYQAPDEVVTDVFSLKAPSTFWDRLSGKEKSLAAYTGFASDSRLQTTTIPTPSPVVPILSTKFEAERAVNMYLERVRQRLQDKLRIGIPSISKIVYVSGNVRNGRLVIGSIPDSLQPAVGTSGDLMLLAI